MLFLDRLYLKRFDRMLCHNVEGISNDVGKVPFSREIRKFFSFVRKSFVEIKLFVSTKVSQMDRWTFYYT